MTEEQPKQVVEDREEAKKRAQQCGQEVFEILAHHRCKIVPYLTSEPIGADGAVVKALIQANYVIIPLTE